MKQLIKTIAFVLLMLGNCIANAEQVHLAWDAVVPVPEGYRIFLRIEGNGYDYSKPAWMGTTTTCTISGLGPNTTYYFVARAYVGEDESVDSNEVSYTTKDLVLKLSPE